MVTKVIKFYSQTCKPCQVFKPRYTKFKEKYKHIVEFVEVDINQDKESPYLRKYPLVGVPTVVFLQENGTDTRIEGLVPYEELEQKLNLEYSPIKLR